MRPVVKAAWMARRCLWLAMTSARMRSKSQRPSASFTSASTAPRCPGSSARLRSSCGSPCEIVEFGTVGDRMDELARAAADHHHRGVIALAHIFPDHVALLERAAFQRRRQVAAIQAGATDTRAGETARSVGSRSRCETASPMRRRGLMPGPANDQRHAHRALVEGHLVPQAALAQHVAMVGGDDDDGVVGKAADLERAQQAGPAHRRNS